MIWGIFSPNGPPSPRNYVKHDAGESSLAVLDTGTRVGEPARIPARHLAVDWHTLASTKPCWSVWRACGRRRLLPRSVQARVVAGIITGIKQRMRVADRRGALETHGKKKWMGRSMNLQFRPAGPGDVEEAVPLIYSAGPPGLDYMYAVGRHKAFDFLRAAFVHGSSMLGYRSHVVAVADGHVVGIAAFYDGAEYGRLSRRIFFPVMRFYGPLTGLGVLRRGIQMQQALVRPPGRDDVLIQHLGVSEHMRGRGIGVALLNNGYDTARSRGFRRCIGDVAVTNPRAQALYERLGCRVVEEREWRATGSGIRLPDVRRVEKLL